MELPFPDIASDEELMEEALAMLGSVVNESHEATTSASALNPKGPPSKQSTATADELLKTAIQAVHAAYPQTRNPYMKTLVPATNNLAFDNEEKPTTYSSDHPVRPTLHLRGADASTMEKNPRSPRSGGGRTRMREQLIQLRSVVQKMEHHLNTLRSPRSPRFRERIEDREAALAADENDSRGVNGAERTSESSGDAAVWRNIAMQQFRARRKAEQQNAKLRESLEAQIQLSKQVENLLEAHLKSIIP